jgi:hypothetical protein
MDFQFLRQEGIRYLQRLSGHIWTDHNLHDPGMTVLDQLCYVLNDLSYRIDHDIRDLLSEENGSVGPYLYSPGQIMTVNPVTLLDIRKTIIDVYGVKNAWVEKVGVTDPAIYLNEEDKSLRLTALSEKDEPIQLKGLYRVLVEKRESVGEDIQPRVRERLMASRNVCEDFAEIRVLESQYVAIAGGIEVGNREDISEFAVEILLALSEEISPEVRFWSLAEMLERGKTIDEIIDGPLLQHGFIDDDELAGFTRKKELYTSDIVHRIMGLPSVNGVRDIVLKLGELTGEWHMTLDPQRTPKLDVDNTLRSLVFSKNGLDLPLQKEWIKKRYDQVKASRVQQLRSREEVDLVPVKGRYRDLAQYRSLKHLFPQVYGIGEDGLPENASPKRRSQASQLNAYLLFFDQLLANYFAQVAQMKDLFSFEPSGTYFHRELSEVQADTDNSMLQHEGTETYASFLAEATESTSLALERKNRFLNHLLARFNENFTHYSLLMYEASTNGKDRTAAQNKLVNAKLDFLRNYPEISSGRFKAFDYTKSAAGNLSGLQKRIAARLGLLPQTEEEEIPFYMIEHILLRPVKEDYKAYFQYLIPREITGFEEVEDGTVKCFSNGHDLMKGDVIVINGAGKGPEPRYNGIYVVEDVLNDTFRIRMPFDQSVSDDLAAKTISPGWMLQTVDTTFMLLTRPVETFTSAYGDKKTNCSSRQHGLDDGEEIEIVGTAGYNGTHKIQYVDADTFRIERAFTGDESEGRWISTLQKNDPYSLQLTFVFPDWSPRMKENSFRTYIEKTIREEVPVHLTVYIRWMDETAMGNFKSAYTAFLKQLQQY